MDETPSSSQHFAAGSYIDLLLAAVIMQITFIITAIWVGTNSNDLLQTNSEHVRHVLKIQLSLGWMMCIIAGLGFSLLPLIYDVKSFDKSLMRSFIGMNMSGQFTIALGIIIRNKMLPPLHIAPYCHTGINSMKNNGWVVTFLNEKIN